MTVTIVETRAVTGGVDTHADTHVAAALDPVGGLLGVEEFPATAAGYASLLGWLGGFGTVCLVGFYRPWDHDSVVIMQPSSPAYMLVSGPTRP
jgi:hypothetical protein